jgi:hypothetical protein
MLEAVRRVASGLCAFALLLSPVVAFAASDATGAPAPLPAPVSEAKTTRRGVAVIAIGADAADAAWPVALAVYGDEALLPRIDDRDARALAGAEPPKDAPKATKELAELRAQVRGDDTASRLLLKEIARRVGALGLVLVFPKTEATPAEARLYDAADDVVEPTLHRETTSGGWSGLVTTLRARYAKSASSPANGATSTPTATPSGGESKSIAPAKPSKSSGSVLGSPWFWGAIGVAVLGAVVVGVAAKGSDSTGTSPVRVEWGK